MSLSLRIETIVFFCILVCVVLYFVRKGRIAIRYSMVWLLSAFIILVAAIWPALLERSANMLGFALASNMVLAILISLLIFISLSLTIIVSSQNTKIVLLTQEVSLLKSKIEKEETK